MRSQVKVTKTIALATAFAGLLGGCNSDSDNNKSPSTPSTVTTNISLELVDNATSEDGVVGFVSFSGDGEYAADRVVNLQSPDGQVYASPAVFTLNATNWDEVTRIPVYANDDSVVEGTHTGALIAEVLDADGKMLANDQRFEFTILDNDTAGVTLVSQSGNTFTESSRASYVFSLGSKPQAPVEITATITPSEHAEVVQVLRIEPDRWQELGELQLKLPDGGAEGESTYSVKFSTVSQDEHYNGLELATIEVEGISLSTSALDSTLTVLAGQVLSFKVPTNYNGDESLSYQLMNGPAGMEIDPNIGLVTWDTPYAEAGSSVTASIRVSDGTNAEISDFTFSIIPEAACTTEVTTNSIAAGEGCSLEGLKVSWVGNITDVEQNVLDASNLDITTTAWTNTMPELPQNYRAVGESFRISHSGDTVVSEDIFTLTQPKMTGLNIASDERLELLAWAQIESDGGVYKWVSLDVGQLGQDSFEANLFALGPIFQYAVNKVGVAPNSEEAAVRKNMRLASRSALAQNQVCNYIASNKKWDCSDNSFRVVIQDLHTAAWQQKVTPEQIHSWLQDANVDMKLRGLAPDSTVYVKVESIPGAYGYVTSADSYKTIHVTKSNHPVGMVQATFQHEYFHQGHVRLQPTFFQNPKKHWITEGLAQWYEDEMFDGYDSYAKTESGLYNLLDVGIASAHGSQEASGYQRFGWWKLLDTYCGGLGTGLPFSDISDNSKHSSMLATLKTAMNENCGFPEVAGANDQFELGLIHFVNATVLSDDFSALDSTEPDAGVDFRSFGLHHEKAAKAKLVHLNNKVSEVGPSFVEKMHVMPGGAKTVVLGNSSYTVGDEEEFYIRVSGGNVGMLVKDTSTIRRDLSVEYLASGNTEYVYTGSSIPEKAFAIINSSASQTAKVSFEYGVRYKTDALVTFTSHVQGDSTSQRVISLNGDVQQPSDGSKEITHVRINMPSIGTVSTVPVVNGSWSTEVIATVGVNEFEAHGLDTSGHEVTPLAALKLNGIAVSGGINALVKSRIVYVLKWDKYGDVDIYGHDPQENTVWYSSKVADSGYLDIDNTTAYGPEVISYRTNASDGVYSADVHYYSGSNVQQYTVAILLNEDQPAAIQYHEVSGSLTIANSRENSPTGSGASRNNNVISIVCSGTCSK